MFAIDISLRDGHHIYNGFYFFHSDSVNEFNALNQLDTARAEVEIIIPFEYLELNANDIGLIKANGLTIKPLQIKPVQGYGQMVTKIIGVVKYAK